MSTNSTLLTPITSTTCLNYIDVNPDPTNSTLAIIIFTIVYTHLFLLGIVGNVAVMYLTMRHRSLQTVQNIFILNLAAADVIVCLLSLPFTPVTSVFKVWLFGKPICHLLPLIQGVGVFISTFSLSAIAIDRYVLVVRPHTHPLNVRGAFVVAAVLWALSAIFTLPYAFYMDLQQYANVCGVFCTEIWPNANARR
jgi:neuropeptide Y receptor